MIIIKQPEFENDDYLFRINSALLPRAEEAFSFLKKIDPSSADYIVVGDKHAILGAGVENSFYYNNVVIHQCYARFKTYEDFINSVVRSYEYRHKNIPSVLVTLITQIRTVIERANHIIRFHNEPEFLQEELAINGYDIIVAFIQLTIGNIEDLEDRMQDYTQNALDDYEGTQLEIETQPTIRNRTTRRTVAHSISNFARALAARARTLTRRTQNY